MPAVAQALPDPGAITHSVEGWVLVTVVGACITIVWWMIRADRARYDAMLGELQLHREERQRMAADHATLAEVLRGVQTELARCASARGEHA